MMREVERRPRRAGHPIALPSQGPPATSGRRRPYYFAAMLVCGRFWRGATITKPLRFNRTKTTDCRRIFHGDEHIPPRLAAPNIDRAHDGGRRPRVLPRRIPRLQGLLPAGFRDAGET